jgi:hypothetical protein
MPYSCWPTTSCGTRRSSAGAAHATVLAGLLVYLAPLLALQKSVAPIHRPGRLDPYTILRAKADNWAARVAQRERFLARVRARQQAKIDDWRARDRAAPGGLSGPRPGAVEEVIRVRRAVQALENTAHLVATDRTTHTAVLDGARDVLRDRHGIGHATRQTEGVAGAEGAGWAEARVWVHRAGSDGPRKPNRRIGWRLPAQ